MSAARAFFALNHRTRRRSAAEQHTQQSHNIYIMADVLRSALHERLEPILHNRKAMVILGTSIMSFVNLLLFFTGISVWLFCFGGFEYLSRVFELDEDEHEDEEKCLKPHRQRAAAVDQVQRSVEEVASGPSACERLRVFMLRVHSKCKRRRPHRSVDDPVHCKSI